MQRMKNLLLVLGGTLDALFLKECYEKMQPHFVVAADGALEKVLAAGILIQSQKMCFVILRRIKIQSYSLFHLKRMRQMQS